MTKHTETITETNEVEFCDSCDVCGDPLQTAYDAYLKLRYVFGYGTPNDLSKVEAEICDNCLAKIIRENIPNARWSRYD